MKESRYMASTELNQLMWLSAGVQALEIILKDASTQNTDWRRWLSTAKTYMHKVIDDRMCKLDSAEKVKVVRRIERTAIKVAHYDDFRYDKSDSERLVTISQSDFLDLVDGASLNCYACPQGDVVKDCPRRKMFHRGENLGMVLALKDTKREIPQGLYNSGLDYHRDNLEIYLRLRNRLEDTIYEAESNGKQRD